MHFRLRTLMFLGTVILCALIGWMVGEVVASGVFNYKPTLNQRVSVAGTLAAIGAWFGIALELLHRSKRT